MALRSRRRASAASRRRLSTSWMRCAGACAPRSSRPAASKPPNAGASGLLTAGLLLLGAHAPAQRIHEVDNLRRLAALARRLDLNALHLLLDELFQRRLVVILELIWREVSG